MSVNRRGRGKGMRRAYLKNFSSDRSPKGGKPPNKDVVKEYSERAQGIGAGAEPLRAQSWNYVIDGNTGDISWSKTPTITEPYQERVKALHKAWANERSTYRIVIARTSLVVVWHVFDGFDARATHWIEWLDLPTRTLRISFTFGSKDQVMEAVRSNKYAWKQTNIPFVGNDEKR